MIGRSGNEFQDTCTMLGLMTITWAWAENTLALTIGTIIENVGPIKGHPEAPLSLKRRVACFRAALRNVVALEPLQEQGRTMATRFIELGVRRNNLVHGAAWQLHEGGFQSVGLGVVQGEYTAREHRFNVEDTVILYTKIAKLQDDAAAFLLKIADAFKR